VSPHLRRVGLADDQPVGLQPLELQHGPLTEELLDQLRFANPPSAVDHDDRGLVQGEGFDGLLARGAGDPAGMA
jgi:hypothetical protein